MKLACEVVNIKGMHARAAAQIVSLVCQYNSEVQLSHGEKSAAGDSLIKLLTLNAPQGSIIEIEVNGPDQAECLDALASLFSDGFGE